MAIDAFMNKVLVKYNTRNKVIVLDSCDSKKMRKYYSSNKEKFDFARIDIDCMAITYKWNGYRIYGE